MAVKSPFPIALGATVDHKSLKNQKFSNGFRVRFIKTFARLRLNFYKFLIMRPVRHQKDVDGRAELHRRILILSFLHSEAPLHHVMVSAQLGYDWWDMPGRHP